MTEALTQAVVDEAASVEMLAAQEGWAHRLAVGTDGNPIIVCDDDRAETADFSPHPYGNSRADDWQKVVEALHYAVADAAMGDSGTVIITSNGAWGVDHPLREIIALLRAVKKYVA